jgi:purine-nucleoside phosphorylase
MSESQAPLKLPIIADLAALPRVPDPVPSPSNEPSADELAVQFTQALLDIRAKLPKELQYPKVGIVCGSGLQGLADILQDRVEVPYQEITGFGESTGMYTVL